MSTQELIKMINDCIAVAKQFKKILDDEQYILRCNDLEKIGAINTMKEALLQEYSTMKSEICESLGMPKKRFDQINIEDHLNSLSDNKHELKSLMSELWDLHHYCHNQFIINRNVILARMQLLNKSMFEVYKNNERNELQDACNSSYDDRPKY